MKNSADQGGCYLQNSSYPTKAEFNNCFIIHSRYFSILKGVSQFHSLFFRSPKITQPRPQVFSVNGSIICSRLHFWRHFDVIGSIICRKIIRQGSHLWIRCLHWTKILSSHARDMCNPYVMTRHNYGRDTLRSKRPMSCLEAGHVLPNDLEKTFFIFLLSQCQSNLKIPKSIGFSQYCKEASCTQLLC